MTQRKLYSFIESWANVALGVGVAFLSQVIIFPLYDIHISLDTNLYITGWFTLISVVRSYSIRRLFNWLHTNTKWH